MRLSPRKNSPLGKKNIPGRGGNERYLTLEQIIPIGALFTGHQSIFRVRTVKRLAVGDMGGGSPDGARLFIRATANLEEKVKIAKYLAGIKEDVSEPVRKI
jgi:hypothetical protein